MRGLGQEPIRRPKSFVLRPLGVIFLEESAF
jgi:hypothetical protein